MSRDEEAEATRKYLETLDKAWEDYERAVALAEAQREDKIALAYGEYRGSLALFMGTVSR